jgi:hypothetical protein
MLIKVGIAILCSISIFVVMMILQNRKEKEAQRKFEMTLKSKGINPYTEEK